jgi:hypothetical protein
MKDTKRETGKDTRDTKDITWEEFSIRIDKIFNEIQNLVKEKNEK